MTGQIFTSINFGGLGFICKYSKNLYTTKISMYTVYTHRHSHTPVISALEVGGTIAHRSGSRRAKVDHFDAERLSLWIDQHDVLGLQVSVNETQLS